VLQSKKGISQGQSKDKNSPAKRDDKNEEKKVNTTMVSNI
jgi:hypothetical protein